MGLTVADWGLLGAVLAYIAPIAIAKYSAIGRFDNARPRDPAFYQDPFRARCQGAERNGLEGFPVFAAAVIVAQLSGGAQPMIDTLAIAYVVLRCAFVAAYIGNRPPLRSTLWVLAFAVNLAIFTTPVWAKG
jgi:uncharacterized MAPEG superfamily protein